ncbi:MAG: inositol monophosphatase [Gammaproteobacteria bacterium]|nr:MAG: inositol monophosphatase [Gammaproteobacteria bacterium]
MLTIARRTVYSAADIITAHYEQLHRLEIHTKAANDFVSNIDIAVEQALINGIREVYPEHLILAEESGLSGSKSSIYRWVIDPIDGTTNFIKGLPHFAISMAVYKNNKLEAGLVYQPITDELFAAARGQGATLNDKKIRASKVLPENGIIATGIPFRQSELMPKQISSMKKVLATFPDIRRAGAASLDLCYVACGRVDGYYEFGLSEWDIAAGALIAQESGAIVSDTNGELSHLSTGNIIAAPPKIYRTLIKITK